jgi:hypothetical protein
LNKFLIPFYLTVSLKYFINSGDYVGLARNLAAIVSNGYTRRSLTQIPRAEVEATRTILHRIFTWFQLFLLFALGHYYNLYNKQKI